MNITRSIKNFLIAFFCSLHGYNCIECAGYARCPVVKQAEEDAKKEGEIKL